MFPPEDEFDGQRAGHHRQPERDQETLTFSKVNGARGKESSATLH